jgi:heterodisulfide reductase subunit A-like polyferredoxin
MNVPTRISAAPPNVVNGGCTEFSAAHDMAGGGDKVMVPEKEPTVCGLATGRALDDLRP